MRAEQNMYIKKSLLHMPCGQAPTLTHFIGATTRVHFEDALSRSDAKNHSFDIDSKS